MDYKPCIDWAARRPAALRLAERLGRSRRRLCVLDSLHRPAKAPLRPNLARWHKHDLAAAWIGHATVLFRVGGRNVLTDPVFARRVGLSLGLATGGPGRLVAPALRIDELPPLDLILVSHAHFDHLDRASLHRLPKGVPVVTSWHNADLVRDLGFTRVSELRWGEGLRVADLSVTALPVAHWGARTVFDRHRGYAGFLVESPGAAGRRVLYGGDSAAHRHFRGLKVDLAILGIGAYDPWIESHATPEQAWAMADDARAEHVLPMHHSTFRLSREPMGEPMERLLAAAGSATNRVVIREVGGQWAA